MRYAFFGLAGVVVASYGGLAASKADPGNILGAILLGAILAAGFWFERQTRDHKTSRN